MFKSHLISFLTALLLKLLKEYPTFKHMIKESLIKWFLFNSPDSASNNFREIVKNLRGFEASSSEIASKAYLPGKRQASFAGRPSFRHHEILNLFQMSLNTG